MLAPTLRRSALISSALFWIANSPTLATEPDPLAVAFGTIPALWNVRISPDGERVSFLQMHPEDLPILTVFDLEKEKSNIALASTPDEFDLIWCEWASKIRLLCGFQAVAQKWDAYAVTRLVAVNSDGSERKVLLQQRLQERFAQFQDRVVDYLVDDPKHVLVTVPEDKGSSVQRLNIYTGGLSKRSKTKPHVFHWVSDGRGSPRLYFYRSMDEIKWYYRTSGDKRWYLLHKARTIDIDDDFYPIGFGDDPDTLYVAKPSDGRIALWAMYLADDERDDEVVFSHPEVDIGSLLFLGKYGRMVAIGYSTDKSHLHFFDKAVESISTRLEGVFADKSVEVVDESWDRRYYIVHVGSDRDPGVYYRFDTQKNQLLALSHQYPKLGERTLSPMQPTQYTSRDGAQIPGYLTLPETEHESGLPTVILPHGGPESRDYWSFDWIVQFLTAKGYAVLQSNFRGSGGYGSAWAGKGGFQAWRTAINDLTDGAQHLVDTGVADPSRVCIVGWSYGGYAALLSAVEEPDRYQCVVSIAGVSDPGTLISDYEHLMNKRSVKAFVGTDRSVLKTGSPAKRADEIRAPVLLFHGDRDLNVSINHSQKMERALKRAKQPVTLIEYENTEHSIFRNEYRIDMLDRIGAFLDKHIGTEDGEPEANPG